MLTKPLLETVLPQTQDLLAEMPEILETVTEAQQRPPLPLGYVPSVIEVFFEDVLYLKSVDGVLLMARDCLADYQPRFVEYRFDDEMALFQVGRDVLVNRIAS
ncbi:hypothetical protein Lepto7375DRAFT_7509 [Leptolyngbya sp. PCC 7375]|nr:hypothetical protein Lepto7375DRAFT_7509 [Leptolyngbya sp. PCC 7375]